MFVCLLRLRFPDDCVADFAVGAVHCRRIFTRDKCDALSNGKAHVFAVNIFHLKAQHFAAPCWSTQHKSKKPTTLKVRQVRQRIFNSVEFFSCAFFLPFARFLMIRLFAGFFIKMLASQAACKMEFSSLCSSPTVCSDKSAFSFRNACTVSTVISSSAITPHFAALVETHELWPPSC